MAFKPWSYYQKRNTPGRIGGVTYRPDYAALIQSNPAYMAFQAQGQQQVAQGAAQRNAAISNLFQQYGGAPTGFTDPYGDVTDAERQLAEQNPYSGLRNLAESFAGAQAQGRRQLAARGGIRSGELGYQAEQLERSRGQAQYDLDQSALQALTDALQGFSETETGAYAGEADLLQGVQQELSQTNPVLQNQRAQIARHITRLVGRAVYRDQWGRLWRRTPNGPRAFDLAAWKAAHPARWAAWQTRNQ